MIRKSLLSENRPVAPAVMVMTSFPLTILSSMSVTGAVAERAPAGIVTLAGTVARAVLLDENVTTSGAASEASRGRVTVALTDPESSRASLGVISMETRVPIESFVVQAMLLTSC